MTPVQLWDCLEYTGYMMHIKHGMPLAPIQKDIERLEKRGAIIVDYHKSIKDLLQIELPNPIVYGAVKSFKKI
jgi:hypothetical protein